MPQYIAEQYFSRSDTLGARRAASAARRAAAQLAREGTDIELVRFAFVREDETCIFTFRADSVESVRRAADLGALAFEHIGPAAPEHP